MWLLERVTAYRFQAFLDSGVTVDPARQEAFAVSRDSGGGSRLLSSSGGVARIAIDGILTPKPDFFAWLFGGGNTTYADIREAIAQAKADDDVLSVDYMISSPGGHMAGLFDTIEVMQELGKPSRAIVSDLAASAAYGLASQADEIVATNKAARFGSIGVLAAFHIDPEQVVVTSSKAPKKAPDVSTKEGQAEVRKTLDGLHDVFTSAIAEGRGIKQSVIDEKFGQGATFLAEESIERGMIDRIESRAKTTTRPGGGNQQGVQMDLAKLKAEHPDVYAAAVQDGVRQERDRAGAHLTMGKASGAMDTAVKAVLEGTEMTATLQSEYMAAGMNRQAQAAAQADDGAAGDAADNVAPKGSDDKPAGEAMDEQVTALLEKRMGAKA